MTYSSNSYLDQSQMTVNAQYILDYLVGQGWTKNSVCGMLGNMQTESTINPGIWENLDSSNTANGFGLVQWTPSTVLTDWANQNGLDATQIDTDLKRILYEVTNNIQWINSSMTFQQFTQSTDTAANLAQLFLTSYERPANQNQPDRQTQATYWFNNLSSSSGGGGGSGSVTGGQLPPPNGSTTNSQIISLLLSDAINGWKL
jgi:hypothetical protein